jgi:hypothetical protein
MGVNQSKFFSCIIELAHQSSIPEIDENIDLRGPLPFPPLFENSSTKLSETFRVDKPRGVEQKLSQTQDSKMLPSGRSWDLNGQKLALLIAPVSQSRYIRSS